jgi:methylglutaconyl-CoA hydratase
LLLAVSAAAAAGVAVLTLNRPDARNAIGVELLKQLRGVLEALQLDTSARALLVCSSVPGVFCAGADLKVLAPFLMLYLHVNFYVARLGPRASGPNLA